MDARKQKGDGLYGRQRGLFYADDFRAQHGNLFNRAADVCFACTVGVTWVGRKTLRAAWTRIRERGRTLMRGAFSAPREKGAPKGFLIDWLMPPSRAEDALYNILGRYPFWVAKHGERRAKLIFATLSIGAIVTFWSDWLLQRVNLLKLLRPSN